MGRKELSLRGGGGNGSPAGLPFPSSLRDNRIAMAVAVGVTFGVICSFIYPHGLFLSSRVNYSTSANFATSSLPRLLSHTSKKASQQLCASMDRLQLLEADLNALREENEMLKKNEAELMLKVKLSQQEREAAQQQLLVLSPPMKAGSMGTVRSLRTNRVVLPDEDLNSDLAKLLASIAINREVIVGISNSNVKDMLKVWFDSLKRVGITNFLVVALDNRIADFCRQHDVPVYRRDGTISAAQAGTGDNHAISGLKFHLLREFLVLGYAVLLSDVDVLYFQNPFHHLYRDCDVEAMTDGFNNQTAYGFDDVQDDPKMGWARYAHTMRIWVFNSGFFYIRPTIPAIELLDRVTARLSREKAWDQAVFNEELFYPSHPGYEGLHASRRTMDYFLFMNSRLMFTVIRKDSKYENMKPVVLHVNYHPDKYERMLALVEYFVHGKKNALKRFPDGSDW